MTRPEKIRLGDLLVNQGLLTAEQLKLALDEQKRSGRKLGRTIDAIGCQTEIAQKIVDQGGDYLLAVKDNQETLAKALLEFFAEGETGGFGTLPVSSHQTVGKDHGRIETRSHLWADPGQGQFALGARCYLPRRQLPGSQKSCPPEPIGLAQISPP